jgi:hypothetical protein
MELRWITPGTFHHVAGAIARRRWRDRFPIWWLAFAVLVMLIVLVLMCWRT